MCLMYTVGHSMAIQLERASGSEFLTKAFVHPGMAQSKQDLDYMREYYLLSKCEGYQLRNGSQWAFRYTMCREYTSNHRK